MSPSGPSDEKKAIALAVVVLLLAAGAACGKYSDGTGEPDDPYQIATPNDLNDIHNHPEDYNRHFILTADIDMNGFNFSAAVIAPDTNPAQADFQGPYFAGLFDGNDHVITNIKIDEVLKDYLGLFGRIGSAGQVANLSIENIKIRGNNCVGGLAASNYGQINYCHATGQLQGNDSVAGLVGHHKGNIQNSTAVATVQGDWYVGALVGLCEGAVRDCSAAGDVSGNSFTGGLAGHLYWRTVSNCCADVNVSSANYVGGLVGYSEWSDVWDCNSTGDTNGTDDVGGLIGWQYAGDVIRCRSAGEVRGNNYCGGLIGKHESGRLISCHAAGDVEGNDYLGGFVGYVWGCCADCSAEGTVAGNDCLGGFAGYADGSFFKCYAIGEVNGHANVGGFAGYCEADSVDSCYTLANLCGPYDSQNHGGLVGNNAGCDISNCYAAGTVDAGTCCGRVVGLNSGTVTNCLWNEDVNGVPLGVGCNDGGTVVNVLAETTAAMQDMNTYTGLGWDFAGEMENGADDFWRIPDEGGYPEFGPGRTDWYDWSTNAGDGTVSNPYQIATAEQLLSIGWRSELLDKCFVVTSDIDLTGYICRLAPIAPYGLYFKGFFDGQGHEISNLHILGEPHQLFVGMFGSTAHPSEVRNLNVSNAFVSGDSYVAGLVGKCYGDITDCRLSASVNGVGIVGGALGMLVYGQAVDVFSTGSVSGDYDIGGLVGFQWAGDIRQCCSQSNVTGRSTIGGLVGHCMDGCIEDCYARANVSGTGYSSRVGGLIGLYENPYRSHVTNSYAAGTVDGNDDVGGFVGYSWLDPHFGDCFWDGDINPDLSGVGNRDDPNVIRRTTVEMQARSTFADAGWDFVGEVVNGPNDVWRMCVDGVSYPLLSWQFTKGDLLCPDGVDFFDYSHLANRWQEVDCAAMNNCDRADLDFSGAVDWRDLKILCDHWLEGVGFQPKLL